MESNVCVATRFHFRGDIQANFGNPARCNFLRSFSKFVSSVSRFAHELFPSDPTAKTFEQKKAFLDSSWIFIYSLIPNGFRSIIDWNRTRIATDLVFVSVQFRARNAPKCYESKGFGCFPVPPHILSSGQGNPCPQAGLEKFLT